MNFQFLYLAIVFFVLQRKYSGTLLILRKFSLLSITFLSGMGVLCISGFDRISDSHFFFLQFLKKNRKVACFLAWKQQKITYFLVRIRYSREFSCEGPCQGFPHLVGLVPGPFLRSRCAPKIKTTSKSDSASLLLSNGIKNDKNLWALKRSPRGFVPGNIDRAGTGSRLAKPFTITIALLIMCIGWVVLCRQ